jgi:hypothetical protein
VEKSKLEAFDLVIGVLREHEDNLDHLINRLDTLVEVLSTLLIRLEYFYEQVEETRGDSATRNS